MTDTSVTEESSDGNQRSWRPHKSWGRSQSDFCGDEEDDDESQDNYDDDIFMWAMYETDRQWFAEMNNYEMLDDVNLTTPDQGPHRRVERKQIKRLTRSDEAEFPHTDERQVEDPGLAGTSCSCPNAARDSSALERGRSSNGVGASVAPPAESTWAPMAATARRGAPEALG